MKKKLNNYLLTLLLITLLLNSFTGFAQSQRNSHSGKLPWVSGQFPEKRGNFDYMVARGEGKSLKEAREDAFNSFLIDLGNNAGVTVNSNTISEIKSNLNYDGNTTNYDESTNTTSTFNIEREGFKASFSKVSEYYEYSGSGYQMWELYEISSGQNFKPVIPEYTSHYGLDAAWKSAILPGWGQFYKGSTTKGVLFLTTEVAAISGLVYCEMKRSDNVRLSQETTNLSIVKEYRDRADSWELNRNILIGAAAGIYVFNVLDAALSKGKIRYAWIPDNVHLTGSENWGNYYCGISINF
jgi:hypothetical protein